MLFSKQIWYCNNCGKKEHSISAAAIGRFWKCCSMACHEQMQYKDALSTLGKECQHSELKIETQLSENRPDTSITHKSCSKCGFSTTEVY